MCDFPSKALLASKRAATHKADVTDDPETVRNAAQFAMTVNQLRLLHEDLTDCRCWYEAVAAESQAKASAV